MIQEQVRVNLESLQAAEKKLLLNTYERNPYLFTSGKGVYLQDENGVEYLDLLSGIGCSALGYGHPALEEAIIAQTKKILHTSNLFFHEHTAPLALCLTEISGLDRVFFTNSGTEAWEAAMKLARAHALRLREEGRNIGTKFLALEHSFHGRTMGSVSTTHKAKYREPFSPLIPTVDFVPLNDVAALRAAFNSDYCAILLETVQGEGGIHPVSQEFFTAARELCDSTGALLIADEIQCGIGRTGKWFAYQHYNVLPDVTTIAKPIAGGVPMGAMLCTEEAAKAFHPGMHGTTFGGNPLALSAAIAVLDTIKRDGILEHVTNVGTYFIDRLNELAKSHEAIKEVRGLGLMIGVELNDATLAGDIARELMERHIIINRTSETVLRFLPPYILDTQHVDIAIAALEDLLKLHENQVSPVLAGDSAHV
jgi:acetylornithine aminotransferase/acetylornithine/N-succinyldiaminopimelate aminotransferase